MTPLPFILECPIRSYGAHAECPAERTSRSSIDPTVMAVPKRRHSKSRTRKRRSTYYNELEPPQLMECNNCGNPKVMHRACKHCGHYRGRQVIEPSDELMM